MQKDNNCYQVANQKEVLSLWEREKWTASISKK